MVKLIDPRPSAPPVGPYGEVFWDAGNRRWERRLTDQGRQAVEDYLGEYPNPIRLLIHAYPALYKTALVVVSHDEIAGACLAGIVRAFTTFDPAQARLSTYLTLWVRKAVQQHLRSLAGGKVWSGRVRFSESPGVEAMSAARSGSASGPGWLDDVMGELTDGERQMVLMVYAEDLSRGAVARRTGLGKKVIKKRIQSAHEKLRVRLAKVVESDVLEPLPV